MVVDAVSLLLAQLNQYLHQLDGNPMGSANPAVMGNISQLDVPETATDLDNHLVLTLVNISEEATLKNGRTFTTNANGTVDYHNAPLHLNLFLLFTANYRNYETALKRLSQVMTFFQGKQKFTQANSPGPNITPLLDFSLTIDLLSLSFEEINHLWGSLGGKQLPFAAYRGRLITLRDRRVLEGGGNIREIEVSGRDATA
ncbi:MAG TPA: DUF4255 domain-containing protein [Gammaproteobacteria bacterium]